MLSILFWNTKFGAVGSLVQQICFANSIDIVILAEDERKEDEIFPTPTIIGMPTYSEFSKDISEVRFFLRSGVGTLHLVKDVGRRQSIREFENPSGFKLLIAGVHLRSKLRAEEVDQYYHARQLKSVIDEVEHARGHDRTIVIGDLNMDPYENGMINADGLHAVMDKATALRITRKIADVQHKFFYNPMWSRLGDESSGPSGTYYHGSDGIRSQFWNTFDQVILRPSLLPYYTRNSVEIVTSVGRLSLLRKIAPSPSDHLPLIFRLTI